jgi:multicomponent Na+:H+ antiporter subunit C
MTTVVAATAALLCSIGTYLVLQRKLSRIIIGVGLLGHGANLLLVTSGQSGAAAIVGNGPPSSFSDPLAQALVLTAIVITFGATAFLLALAYRSWILSSDDEVVDDVDDRTVAAGGFDDREVTDEEQQVIDAAKDRHAEDTS